MSRKRSVYLHVPELEELGYRKSLLADPETMSYNKGFDIPFDGYDKDTGCIDFTEEKWAEWYEYFINSGNKRFYAYVMRYEDDQPVGEVCLHNESMIEESYEMGVVIQAKYRHCGYGKQALELLLRHAFVNMEALEVINVFERSRSDAMNMHMGCGFWETPVSYFEKSDPAYLHITKDMYTYQNYILTIDDRFVIRQMKEDDLDFLYSLLSDEETMKYLEPVFDREKTEEFLQKAGLSDPPLIYMAEDADEDMLGYVIFHEYDESFMEIGWVLKKEACEKGYASRLTDVLYRKASRMKKDCVIECTSDNEVTKHIALKKGFALCEEKDGLLVYRKKQIEYWDAYDRNLNNVTGILALTRGEPIPEGVYHLVCDIIVRHKDGSYLLMRRAANKKFGGMWEATAGGSALYMESPQDCAERELYEETGIQADSLLEVGRVVSDRYHTVFVEFLCETDWPKDEIKVQKYETDAYKWVSKEELLAMAESGLVTKRTQSFIDDLKKEKD